MINMKVKITNAINIYKGMITSRWKSLGTILDMGYQSLFVIRFAYGTMNVFDIYTYMAAIQVLFF